MASQPHVVVHVGGQLSSEPLGRAACSYDERSYVCRIEMGGQQWGSLTDIHRLKDMTAGRI